jgi:GNAT superfamily N-acetyltransferase
MREFATRFCRQATGRRVGLDEAFFALAAADPNALCVVDNSVTPEVVCLINAWTRVGFLWGDVGRAAGMVRELPEVLRDHGATWNFLSVSGEWCAAMSGLASPLFSTVRRVSYSFNAAAYSASRASCSTLPPGHQLNVLTHDLYPRVVSELDHGFSGVRCNGRADVRGYVLRAGDRCVAYAWAPVAERMAEIGIATAPDCRRQGLARIVATRFIDTCLREGWQPRVSTTAGHTPAMRWAESLGFKDPTEHNWLVVRPADTAA